MANPNRTVAAFLRRKLFVVKQQECKTQGEAQRLAEGWREGREFARVTATSYKIGPKAKPVRQWIVRAYN
jgi:hypothetical protein